MLKKLIIPMAILSTLNATAAEVDQFTRRNEALADSSEKINAKANEFINLALSNLKANQTGCNEKELYKELRKYFANHAHGELTKYALHSDEIERRTMKIQDSIFKDWTIFDGYLLGKPGANASELALSPLVRMGDVVIGVDKFEHMFGRGFSYFNQHYLKNKTIVKAIKSGIIGEKTLYGGNKLATGVFSYGDLSANFNGMRFWNHILMKEQDAINDNYGPYITCVDNEFTQVKKVDFTHYIDSAMDEAINCSKFPTKKTAEKYAKNVTRLIEENNLSQSNSGCPIDPNKVVELKNKYGEFSKFIINSSNTDRTINYVNEIQD